MVFRRRHNWRPWPAVPALVLAALLLAACLKKPPEPVTITFACPRADQAQYAAWAAQFSEQLPHITVELEPKAWDMLNGLSAGGADCYLGSQFSAAGSGSSMLDLAPLIADDESFDKADFVPGTLRLYTYGPQIRGIPAHVDLMVMYYSRDLFDEAEFPYPPLQWTWHDFVSTAAALRDPKTAVFGYLPTLEIFDALVFIYQHGGGIFDDLERPRQATFDHPQTISALNWFLDLMYDYNVMPTPEQAQESFGYGDARSGIYQSKVAMWTGMLSEQGGQGWPTAWSMDWGVTTLPRDARAATLAMVPGYYISASTEHPEACWEWISFLSRQIPAGPAPARPSLVESQAFEDQVGDEMAAVVRESLPAALMLSPELAQYEQAMGAFMQAFQTILSGQATPQEAMTYIQRQIR